MSVFLGALKITNAENSKAFIQYKVKGRNKYIYFKRYSDALSFERLLKKNMKKGTYRESFEDIKVKFLG